MPDGHGRGGGRVSGSGGGGCRRGCNHRRHCREGAHDLELARGFAGEVEYAVEVTGTELAEGEFEQDASFTETGWGFEKYCRMALEG